jgi:hypothetical protein
MIINGEEVQLFVDVNDFRNVVASDAKALGCEAYITRATKGDYLTNPQYTNQVFIARNAQPWPFLSYHTLVPHSIVPIERQVRHFNNVFRQRLAGTGMQMKCMLNVETTSEGYQPSYTDVTNFLTLAMAEPYNLDFRILYLARWYHQVMGSPNLVPLFTQFPNLRLTNAQYAKNTDGTPATGTPAEIYAKSLETGWAPFGGITPTFLQYTDRASISSTTVDCNAFKGTKEQLYSNLGWSTMANTAPTAPTVTASASTGKPGDVITVTAASSDPDNRTVTLLVSASNGVGGPTSVEVPVTINVTDTITYNIRTTDTNVTVTPVAGQPGRWTVTL